MRRLNVYIYKPLFVFKDMFLREYKKWFYCPIIKIWFLMRKLQLLHIKLRLKNRISDWIKLMVEPILPKDQSLIVGNVMKMPFLSNKFQNKFTEQLHDFCKWKVFSLINPVGLKLPEIANIISVFVKIQQCIWEK